MSRYIDVSNLDIPSDENDYDELVAFADKIAEMIVDAPSIDIVFCKECKYEKRCTTNVHFLADNGLDVIPVHFCSHGEREGE